VATNTWVHLAGTLGTYITNGAGTNLVTNLIKRLYVDGALAASVTNVGFTPNGQRPLRIGAGSTESTPGSLPFPGFLDDVQLYGYPLEATNIQALYNSGLGGVVSTGAVGHYRLDEHFAPLSRTSGFQQAMAALSGETWQASIHLAHPSINPLMNTNLVQVDLLYLNSTGGVLSTFSAPQFDTASPRDQYIRYAARGTAPSGTVSAALRVQYRQDAGYSPGIVYADDAVLTPFAVTSGLSCAIIPDFRYVVQATDTCSAVTIIQDPSPGSVVGGSNVAVRFIAADACGLATTGGIEITIMDTTAPTAVTLPPIAVGCIDQVPPPNPGGVVATDNCGSVFVTLETNVVGATGGCGAAPKTILYRYRITDASGNFGFVNQLIQVRDSNAPVVVCVMPDLTNGTFEASTFANWSTFGTHLYLTNLQPRSGSGHAVFYGATNGLYNFTGLYQDLPAAPGPGLARRRVRPAARRARPPRQQPGGTEDRVPEQQRIDHRNPAGHALHLQQLPGGLRSDQRQRHLAGRHGQGALHRLARPAEHAEQRARHRLPGRLQPDPTHGFRGSRGVPRPPAECR
jgi:hypothetical protein